MGAFWRRMLTVERRMEYYRRTIGELQRTITALQQQVRATPGAAMIDQRGPAEARLLHVERGIAQMDRDLRTLRRDAIAPGQAVWGLWSDAGSIASPPAPPMPTPTPTPTFTACCSTISPGPTIAFTDSIWGSGTMTYNSSLGKWLGYLSGLAYPGGGGCGACTIAIAYIFDATAQTLQLSWIINSATSCPVASTPTSSPGAGQSFSTITYFNPSTVFYCDTTPETGFTFMGTTAPELLLRTGHASETISFTFAGTTASGGTSDFTGVCSCVPWTLTLTDSVYGPCTLTYNPLSQTWSGCTTVAYAGTVNCAAGSIAIQYVLTGSAFGANWNMVVNWAGHTVSGHACPLPGATCASTLNFSRGPISVSGGSISCSGTNTWSFGASTNSPWPGTGAATLTIPF